MTLRFLCLILLTSVLSCGGRNDGIGNDGVGGQSKAPADRTKAAPTASEQLGLSALDAWIAEHPISKDLDGWKTRLLNPIDQVKLDPAMRYQWRLTTDRGTMLFDLFDEYAPRHVMNAAYLSRIGFYDGIGFHRVITNFMAQGGCPKGDGSGGTGYSFAGEFHPENPGHAIRGMLSTANSGPNTDSSQFFITFAPQPGLNPKHTVWGRLIEGQDTFKRLELVASSGGTPKSNVKILKAEILEIPR